MLDRRNVRNLYPLTALQEGMLFHALREPDSRAYFERLEFGLEGALDPDAYRAAWQDVVDRHDILRTVFVVKNTPRPVQVVLRECPVALVWEDLSALAPEAARARIEAWKHEDLARGFALTREVPMRLAVFRLDAHHHRVVWGFHHILLDGWCLGILQRDLDTCYLARLEGRSPSLPPAPPYAAYVRWLEARDKSGERAADASFWRALLAGFEQPTPVPRRLAARFDTPALPEDPSQRDEINQPLSDDAQQRLDSLARGLGVTPSSVVQTLWGLVLGASQGRRDAVFAATVSGRPAELPGADATVGLFINAVPVRVRHEATDTLAALVRRVHEQAIAARPHHATPLADAQALSTPREGLIDHILVFENYPEADTAADPRLPRLRTDGELDLHEYTHYGFEFQFLPGAPSVLRFRFDTRLHDRGELLQLAARFQALLLRPEDESVDAALAAVFPGWRGPRRLALAASFTAEPVVEALAAWLRQFGQPGEVELAPYNQCASALLDPAGALARAELAFLLHRMEDALRDLEETPADGTQDNAARLRARHQAMLAALTQWRARADAPPLVVALLPPTSPGDSSPLATLARELDADWRKTVREAASPRLITLDLAEPAGLALATGLPFAAWPDPLAQRLGHVPYTDAGCAALGATLARPVLARARAPFKVLAVDCDNTLWQGVCGEAGALGVRVGPAQAALQRFLIERQQEGFLIVLASKNIAEDVWAVFDNNPDMLLRREHITAAAVNWQAKSGNLRELARQLNLGIDSFIFLDDNPAEIAEVSRHCPEVLAFPVPVFQGTPEEDALLAERWLSLLWARDVPAVTQEDRERTRMMQEEASRQAILASARDLDEFLAGIGLRLAIGPMAPHQLTRVAQLTQRTNQFNLSGKRRNEAEVAELAARDDTEVLAVEVQDRFGSYGLTGVVIARHHAERAELEVDSYLLSCRVLGRRVENGILAALGRIAAERGCRRVVAPLKPTERNEPIRQYLATAPWRESEPHLYTCSVEEALQPVPGIELADRHVFLPPAPASSTGAGTDSAAAPEGGLPEHAVAAAIEAPSASPLPLPVTLENESGLRHAAQFLPWLAAAAGWPARIPPALRGRSAGVVGASASARVPAGASEIAVANIWAEVLGLDGSHAVPAEIPFAELGGHSLHAVRVVSRLERHAGRRLGLARFYQLNTVAALARWLDEHATSDAALPSAGAIPLAGEADDYPLSHAQYRIWLLSRLGNADAAYNQCAAWRIRGALDVAALQGALDLLAARHESLRTVFVQGEHGPRQRILPAASLPLSVHRDESDAVRVAARIAHAARQPFDLEQGPLLRASLYALAPDDHVLALTLHHVISDGWSFATLMDDLTRAYRDGVLPPAPQPRYRDYAVWDRSPAHDAELAAQGAYWRARFATLPAIAAVPPDRPRPPVASGRGATLRRALPLSADERRALDALLASSGASLFQLLSALVMGLVARHGEALVEADDAAGGIPVRIGTPVAGRDRPELESLVGLFVNTLVLNARVNLEAPFTTLLSQLRDTALAALEHQHYPFDRLVEDLAPERDAGRNPLFDVLVALQNAPRADEDLAGLRISELPLAQGGAAFDLVFEFIDGLPDGDGQPGLALALTHATDLYDADSAARLADRLHALLRAVLAAPGSSLGSLALHDAKEAAWLAAHAAGPLRPLPDDNLAERFARLAALHASRPALITDQLTLDYATLARRADALAARLLAAGVAAGERVAVLLPRSADWAVALLAVLRAGAVYLPLEARNPAGRLRETVLDAGARVLLAPAALGDALALPELLRLDPAETPPTTAALPAAWPRRSPQDEAYLLYTSGSTGQPKGVRVSHGAFLNMIAAQIDAFAISADDVALQLASCAFDASLSETFLAWFSGAALALADEDTVGDSARLGAFLARHRVSLATFTPSYLRQLEDRDLASLRRVILAGEAARGRDVARLLARGIVPYNAYGPTETAVCATLGQVLAAPADAAPVPIGRPIANLRVEIRDPRGAALPVGVPGELVILGAGVADGYWRRDELNAQRFLPAGAPDQPRGYRSGDLARWRADGQLEYLGRTDEQLKLRGLRVEPGEIAARLLARPGVAQAAVSVENGPAGADLVAWLAPASGATLDTATLRAAVATELPPYMLPARWVLLPELPLKPSGKLDRDRLSLPAATDAPAKGRAPRDALETTLLAAWREALGEAVDIDSDFFLAGGNSLQAMKTARRIADQLGRPCPAILLFRHPNVAALAEALRQADTPVSTGTLRWGHADAPLKVLALPPAPGLGAVYAPLAARLGKVDFRAVDLEDAPLAQQIEAWADGLPPEEPAPLLLGHSGGGRLALALAAVLVARGTPPRAVVLADCWRWKDDDPALQPILADMARHAADDDRALARLTGIATDDADAVVNRGLRYRALLAGLAVPDALPVPIHHLLAEVDPAQVPAGFSRDWRDVSTGDYHEHALLGGHSGLLSGPSLEANVRHLATVLHDGTPAVPPPEMAASTRPAPCVNATRAEAAVSD